MPFEWNTTEWNSPGGPPSANTGALDTTTVIDGILPTLHADSRADLVYWTEGDLITWMDEGLKRLARTCGVFIERDTSITTSNGTALYPLPERQDATLHVSFGTAGLKPASMLELEMRSASFQTDAGTPDHWYEDGQGWNVGVSPVPTIATQLPLIMTCWPPELDAAKRNTFVQGPAPLAGYLAMYAIGKALGEEGEAEMPDVAQHCMARCEMYEQIFQRYYGNAI